MELETKSHSTGVSTFACRIPQKAGQKSFHLSHPDKIELKKISSPTENKKYATAQPNGRQESVAVQTPKPLTVKRFNYSVDRRAACNSGFKKLAVQWLQEVQFSKGTFVVTDSLVLRNRQLFVAAKR